MEEPRVISATLSLFEDLKQEVTTASAGPWTEHASEASLK